MLYFLFVPLQPQKLRARFRIQSKQIRNLYQIYIKFISSFSHLAKCMRNAFVAKGQQIPDDHANVEVGEAWENDTGSRR